MVTATIYSSAGTKIIDIGDMGLQPWLEETTYLMDQAGRTTATIAQTVSPTFMTGTGPFPTPFVTGPAPSSETTYPPLAGVSDVRPSIVPPGQTTAPSSTITTPPNPPPSSLSKSATPGSNEVTNGVGIPSSTATAKPPMLNTILGVAVGVLAGLVIGISYYFYRRRKSRRARKEAGESGSEDNWNGNASPAPINYEKVMNVARAMGKVKAVFDSKGRDERDEGWSQRWPQEKPGRPQQSRNELGINISHDEYAGTPPPPFDADDPTRPPIAPPVSILKQPPIEPRTTLIETAQSLIKRAPTYEPTYAEKKRQVRNKGVRFGPDQVREFGWTPVASREPSFDGSETDSDNWSVDAALSLESGSSNMSDREMEGEVLKKAMAELSKR